MTLRSLVFSTLTTDTYLNSLGFTPANVFTTHDEDTPQARPFMILRWGRTDVGLNDEPAGIRSNLRRLMVWVHDNPGDFDLIELSLDRVRTVLTGMSGAWTGTVGKYVGQIKWDGDSDDLRDDVVGTITRNSSFTIVGSAA
jgi:hypothetical protein